MYNKDIYKHLDEKFGAFNMLLISQGIAEMYRYMSDNVDNEVQCRDFEFESLWWNNAQKNAETAINNEHKL
jgi:hypothetical protein